MSPDLGRRPPEPAAAAPPAVAIFGSFRLGQYFEDILAGVVAAADAVGSSVISIQTSDGVLPSSDEVGGQEAVSRAAWDHVDAAIVILQTLSPEYVARLRAAGKFVVAIGQELRGAHTAVGLDNAGGVRDAVAHLVEHGHTRIGFVSPGWQVDAPERYAAYREQMLRSGLAPFPPLGADLPRDRSMDEQGVLAARRLVAEGHAWTAVVVAPDLVALGFMRALREAGLEVPGDVAVVGIDDVDEAAVSAPPLATVAISFEQVGETAFTVARRGAQGRPTQDHYRVPQRFVPRESCGCVRAAAAPTGAVAHSPVQVLAAALADAARESSGDLGVDVERASLVAHAVVDLLAGPIDGGQDPDPPSITDLAAQINRLCPLDRSVRAALRAIWALAHTMAQSHGDVRPERVWASSTVALDLCDAVRSGQLQRRMAEFVDLKRLQVNHYFIGNSLLSHDRDQLRSLEWLHQTPAEAGALGLWSPPGQTGRMTVNGVYERSTAGSATPPLSDAPTAVEAFPPRSMLRDPAGRARLVIVTQVRFENSDWGVLAVAGGRILQSSLVQETFHQWAILMSASLDAERADADLARQAAELTAAYETEMALLEAVRISEERHVLAAEAARDALWDWDIASGTVFYSSRWKAMLGFRDHEVGTAPAEWLERIHPDDARAVRDQLDRALTGVEQYIDVEHRLRAAGGEDRWIACSGRTVTDDHGRPVRLVGSITDVTVRRLLQEQLVQEALYDGLTGLAKAALFHDRLGQAMELARRRPGYRFAVVFLDLDGFKAVNDGLGHAAGDQLLASVARRLEESLRRNDTAARLGGDEFVVLLTDVERDRELELVVGRLHQLITAPHQVGDVTATVGAAIGVAVSDEGYATPEEMLHAADTAMYREKRRSKRAAHQRSPSPASAAASSAASSSGPTADMVAGPGVWRRA
jgi:diguanylate cyclase (GGDEF)-like protein/PAS domain S-box-containing protein